MVENVFIDRLYLYKNQTVLIDINGKENVAKIKRSVRQGCILSHVLFYQYFEEMMKELIMKVKQGVRIDVLGFVDDIAFCVKTEENFQNILVNVNRILEYIYGMQINKKKVPVIVYSKINIFQLNTKIDYAHIEQV